MNANRSWGFVSGFAAGMLFLAIVRLPSREVEAQDGKLPFASSVEQRQQSVEELRKLNALMQKQIDLLTSGKVRVTVVDEKTETGRRKADK